MRRSWILAVLLASASSAWGAPARLVALAAADDARKAVAIGPAGEVYAPDGKGAWVHRLQSSTASALSAASSGAGGTVFAFGEGVVYRLAGNGWSAIRLVQHGKAVLGAGSRARAAVGRQIYALDATTQGEPNKLAVAPGAVVALAAGAKAIVVATDVGVFRLGPGKPTPIPAAPRRVRLVSERWAIADRGALDLTTGKLVAWPGGLTVGPAAVAGDALVAVASSRAGLELITLRAGTFTRDALGLSGSAVGVVVDRAGRAVVALSDGRIALRERAGWTTTEVTDEPAAARPGAPPSTTG